MIRLQTYTKAFAAGLLLLATAACSDPWEDHSSTTDDNLGQNLTQRIVSGSQTSDFGALLEETGFSINK